MTVERSIQVAIAKADLFISNYWPIVFCSFIGLLIIMACIMLMDHDHKNIK